MFQGVPECSGVPVFRGAPVFLVLVHALNLYPSHLNIAMNHLPMF